MAKSKSPETVFVNLKPDGTLYVEFAGDAYIRGIFQYNPKTREIRPITLFSEKTNFTPYREYIVRDGKFSLQETVIGHTRAKGNEQDCVLPYGIWEGKRVPLTRDKLIAARFNVNNGGYLHESLVDMRSDIEKAISETYQALQERVPFATPDAKMGLPSAQLAIRDAVRSLEDLFGIA